MIKKYKLVDKKQIIDFSSTYFEGTKSELAHFEYSRDKLPGKLQITFGISTGLTGIPSAITIQKGNVQDKKHMKLMIKIVSKVLPKGSILIFDTGANTKKNRQSIRGLKYHYLTLRAKKVGPYKKYINFFNTHLEKDDITHMKVNNRHYSCVKRKEDEKISYIYFCPELYLDQLKAKDRKFERQKEKVNKVLKKRKHQALPSEQ